MARAQSCGMMTSSDCPNASAAAKPSDPRRALVPQADDAFGIGDDDGKRGGARHEIAIKGFVEC